MKRLLKLSLLVLGEVMACHGGLFKGVETPWILARDVDVEFCPVPGDAQEGREAL